MSFSFIWRKPDLNRFRYKYFLRRAASSHSQLSCMPPTVAAAEQHSFRVYLQVQAWLGNTLPATQWGWRKGTSGFLEPIETTFRTSPNRNIAADFMYMYKVLQKSVWMSEGLPSLLISMQTLSGHFMFQYPESGRR